MGDARQTTAISVIRKRPQWYGSEHTGAASTLLVCRASQGADLDGAVGGDQLVLEVPRPEAGASQVRKQVLIHHRELPRQHPPHVDVAGVRLEALVVAQNLRAARGESARTVHE